MMKKNNIQNDNALSNLRKDITYSNSAKSITGKYAIKILENLTGRMGLIRRAQGYQQCSSYKNSFFQAMVQQYGVSMEITSGSLQNIPKVGPIILVANHPFGILDGLIMGFILSEVRASFKIMAHQVFGKSTELSEHIIPISFDDTGEAIDLNIASRKSAVTFLKSGGAIGIFPGGTVSTSKTLFSEPLDPIWRSFTARMISRSEATVIPIYFEGHNSRLFQLASHLNYNLRMALLMKEFKNRIDRPIKISVGRPIGYQELKRFSDNPKQMMKILRGKTYAMGTSKDNSREVPIGYEFEERYKSS